MSSATWQPAPGVTVTVEHAGERGFYVVTYVYDVGFGPNRKQWVIRAKGKQNAYDNFMKGNRHG